MIIRPATLAEMPQMLQCAWQFLDTTPYSHIPYDDASMTREFIRMMDCGLCILAMEGDTVIGGVGAVKGGMFFNESVSVAGERFWWVAPQARGNLSRVGFSLLLAISGAAKAAGCEYLMMLSLADDSVDKIYSKLGFTEVERGFLRKL